MPIFDLPFVCRALVLGITFALLPSAAYPQPAEPTSQSTAGQRNSINISPLSLLLGSAFVNYERMLNHHHAVVVDVGFANSDRFSLETKGASALIGYRYHWSGGQDSGFIGASLSHGQSQIIVSDLEDVPGPVKFDMRLTAFTANVGRRWAWDNGLNITLRGGLGYGRYNISSDASAAELDKAVDASVPLSKRSVAIDSELTIGYSF